MDALLSIPRKEVYYVSDVRFEQHQIVVTFLDGNELTAPLAWFPKLYYASPAQLSNWQIMGKGMHIHWADLNEDISVDELMRGGSVIA
jgi:hypothetical protein